MKKEKTIKRLNKYKKEYAELDLFYRSNNMPCWYDRVEHLILKRMSVLKHRIENWYD